ncbi:MAG TPA: creatininase family protein [Methylomirabilota bacterium]|nr:creatininase family protein [Methylomirabilota bacterium]
MFRRVVPDLLIAITCLAVLAPTGARGEAPDTVFLEDLTWTEVRDAIRAGKTTIIIPAGGTEQNGPHMALGKHNARVRVLSERIARRLGDALVAPVIAYVPEGAIAPPTGHMRYPGTITTPDDAFQKVLESAARSFRAHGFRHIVLLGDHGSTQAGQHAVAGRLNREWAASRARVHAIDEYYRAAETEVPGLLRARGYRDAELGRHAGLTDTSLMLATDARLVRTDRLRPGREGDGVDGDPTRATAELGRAGADLIVTRTVDAIRKSITPR